MESYSTQIDPFIKFYALIESHLIDKINAIKLGNLYKEIGLEGKVNAFLWQGLEHKESLNDYQEQDDFIKIELFMPEELFNQIKTLANEHNINYYINALIYVALNYDFSYLEENLSK